MPLPRIQAITAAVAAYRGDPVIISPLADPDAVAAYLRDENVCLLPGPGLSATSLALGLSLALESRTELRAVAIESAASAEAVRVALATMGQLRPVRFRLVILDGGVPHPNGHLVDAAAASGIEVLRAEDDCSFVEALREAREIEGPACVYAAVLAEPPDLPVSPPVDTVPRFAAYVRRVLGNTS